MCIRDSLEAQLQSKEAQAAELQELIDGYPQRMQDIQLSLIHI